MFFLQETFLRENKSFRINNFNIIRKDRVCNSNYNPHGGVAIGIHKDIKYQPLMLNSPNTESEVVGIIAKIKNIEICLISIYCKPKHKISHSQWNSLYNKIRIYPNIFIFGDFNANHQMWSPDMYLDEEGDALESFISEHNLIILNNDGITRVPRINWRNSIIDLTIVTSHMSLLVDKWEVHDDSCGSDHFPIFLQLFGEYGFLQNRVKKYRNFKKANWNIYKEKVEDKLTTFDTHTLNELELKYKFFETAINEAVDVAVPFTIINNFDEKRSKIPWWDKECNHEIAKRKLALTKFNRSGSMNDYIQYKRVKAQTRRYIKKRQRTEWQKFCEKMNPQMGSQNIWKTVRNIMGKPLLTRSFNNDWVPNFISNYCGEENINDNAIWIENQNQDYENLEMTSEITINELKQALSHNKNTSTGFDKISYRMLKELPEKGYLILTQIMNESIKYTKIPQAWKEHLVIPILKPLKCPNEFTSYRPITLLSCVGKTMENIIKTRIEWYLEHYKLMPKSQFGFQKNKGVMDNLHILKTDIDICFSKNQYMLAIFVDIKGAYDSVDLKQLSIQMKRIGIHNIIVKWIVEYFRERSIRVRVEESIDDLPFTVYKGIPQGSILSPILYIIYTLLFDERFRNGEIKILQYADDIVLYITGKKLEEIKVKLEEASSSFIDICGTLKLVPSTEKTQLICYTRHRITEPIQISFNGEYITNVNCIKYLGIWFDSKLSWNMEIKNISQKCFKSINLMRKMAGVSWGCHPKILLLVYRALVRSHIDFATTLIDTSRTSNLEKLDKIQRKALRIVTGCMISTPIQCVYSEAGEPPIEARRVQIMDKCMLKYKSNSQHQINARLEMLDHLTENSRYWANKKTPAIIKSHQFWKTVDMECFDTMPIFQEKFDIYQIEARVNINSFTKFSSKVQLNSCLNEIIEKGVYSMVIFTDGSVDRDAGISGYAVYEKYRNIRRLHKINKSTSSFLVEMLAIKEALLIIKEARDNPLKTIIFSDSKSVLQCLKNNNIKSINRKHIIEIKLLLQDLYKRNIKVDFFWIPSHSGIIGNELVDGLAKLAITEGENYNGKLPTSEFFPEIQNRMYKIWEDFHRKRSVVKGKDYYSIQEYPLKNEWFENDQSRKYITTLIRMRTNHCQTPFHLNKIKLRNNNICDCGEEVGDLNHVIFQCKKYDAEIRSFLNDILKYTQTLPIDIKFIIIKPTSEISELLYKHIIKCGLKI